MGNSFLHMAPNLNKVTCVIKIFQRLFHQFFNDDINMITKHCKIRCSVKLTLKIIVGLGVKMLYHLLPNNQDTSDHITTPEKGNPKFEQRLILGVVLFFRATVTFTFLRSHSFAMLLPT